MALSHECNSVHFGAQVSSVNSSSRSMADINLWFGAIQLKTGSHHCGVPGLLYHFQVLIILNKMEKTEIKLLYVQFIL